MTSNQIFTENIPTLKTTTKKIHEIMKTLEETGTPNSEKETNHGRRTVAEI